MIIIKPIKPKAYRRPAIRDEIKKEAERIGKDISKTLDADVATWKNKPKFKVKVTLTTKKVAIDVFPSGTKKAVEIYGFVNEGTRRHPITPKRSGGTLRFKWGGPGSYSPKTQPGRSGSTKAYQGGNIVYRKSVMHPGNKGRHFGKYASKQWSAQIPRRLQEAINRGTKLSGHAYYERFGI